MFDIVCILGLYFLFLLTLLGVEIPFVFSIGAMICTTKLAITGLKFLFRIPIQEDEPPKFWRTYLTIATILGSSSTCVLLTVHSTWSMKIIFFSFLAVTLLIALILKNAYVRNAFLVATSLCYGIILAKWYQINPLEGRFGDNGLLDSIAIVLSAILFIIPIAMISEKNQEIEE